MVQWEWWIKKCWLEGLSAQGKIFQQGRYNTPGARLGSRNTWSLCMNSWPMMGGIDLRVQADFCCFFPYIWCFGGYISFLARFNKGLQTGKLKITEMYFKKARSLKSRCWQGHTFSETCKGESFFASSRFWCLLSIIGLLGLPIHYSNLCLLCHMDAWMFPPVCSYHIVFFFFFFNKDNSHIGIRAYLLQ